MTKKEIAALACRMLALFFIFGAFIEFVNFYLTKLTQNLFGQVPLDFLFSNLPNPLEIFLGMMLVPCLLALVLWIFADWFGKKIIREKDHQTKTSLSSVEIQSVFLSVIGLLFILGSLIQLIQVLISPIIFKDPYIQSGQMQFLGLLIPVLFELFMGGLLVYNAKRISHFLQKK